MKVLQGYGEVGQPTNSKSLQQTKKLRDLGLQTKIEKYVILLVLIIRWMSYTHIFCW